MNLLALVFYVLFLVVAFGARTFVQWRRTGDTGLRIDAGPVGGIRWWATAGFLAAVALNAAAPLAGLAGVRPLSFMDTPLVSWFGVALAVLGIAATVAAQLAMGDSWRIGVDPDERTTLVTAGPFAVVRNPIFTSFLVASTGLTLMVGNLLALCGFAALLAAIELQVRIVEEPYLYHAHGPAYSDYAARVGRFLPHIGRVRQTTA